MSSWIGCDIKVNAFSSKKQILTIVPTSLTNIWLSKTKIKTKAPFFPSKNHVEAKTLAAAEKVRVLTRRGGNWICVIFSLAHTHSPLLIGSRKPAADCFLGHGASHWPLRPRKQFPNFLTSVCCSSAKNHFNRHICPARAWPRQQLRGT